MMWQVVTARADRQARQKGAPEVDVHLNEAPCEEDDTRSEEGGEVERWHGPRLLGGEGSAFTLPDTEETRRLFSVQTNQDAGGEQVPALGAVWYDRGNDLGLRAALGPKQAEKNVLFAPQWSAVQGGTCWWVIGRMRIIV